MSSNNTESSSPQQQQQQLPWSKSLQKQLKGVGTKKKYQDKVDQVNALLQPLQVPWVYKNEEMQRKAKELLLGYWEFLLREASNATLGDRHTFFNEMVLIIRRKEFDIFSLDWKDGRILSSSVDRKLAVQYHNMLVETMLFCINKLAKTGAYTALMEFSSKVLAVCYFCFPGLTKATIEGVWPEAKEKIARDEDAELGEDVSQLLPDATTTTTEDKSSILSLDQVNCSKNVKAFKLMSKYYLAIDDHGNAGKLTHHTSWLKRFSHESIHFIGFLVDIIEQATYLTSGEAVQWEMIPGYTQLVHAFLYQIKHKMGINEWKTRIATQCLASLMQNPRLFSILIKVIYSKTNVNDSAGTETSLDILTDWFNRMRDTYTYLPRDFDYGYFFKGLVILLEGEHHVTLVKALTFIYNTIHMYLGKPRRRFICDVLYKQFFFKFFLHWHPQVRGLYQQLIVFKTARVREEIVRMRQKAVKIRSEKNIDRIARGIREAYVDVVKQRVEWNEQKKEEVAKSIPQSPSVIIKGLKKEAKAKAEAEEAEAKPSDNNNNNGGGGGGGTKKDKKKDKKEKEEERKRKEESSTNKTKPKFMDSNGFLGGRKKDSGRMKDSNGEKGGMLWRKGSKKDKSLQRKDIDRAPSRGSESDEGSEENFRLVDAEDVKKVSLNISPDEFPPSLEIYAGVSLLKYEETLEHYRKWTSAIETLPDGSVRYPDTNSLILSTPKADREI